MNKATEWTVPKWPFFGAYIVLMAFAFGLVFWAGHPVSTGIYCLLITGSVLVCLPYILECMATGKVIEANAAGTVAEQLVGLKEYADQIAAATNQWALVQETTRGHADKTVAATREITERMAGEIRDFNEFQVKLNDTEKTALRLEVEKLRRAEGEWLQVLARIMDHIFALYNAASRSGNADLTEQIGHFQNACREATRRVGLTPFSPAPGDKFDAQKHRVQGGEAPPTDALVAESLAPGLTYQGRLIRPALVILKTAAMPDAPVEPGELPLETTGSS